jgi:predicted N-acetyltransferase YhbS
VPTSRHIRVASNSSDGAASLCSTTHLDMQATRQDIRLPEWVSTLRARLAREGIAIRPAREDDATSFFAFVDQHFSPTWRTGAETMLRARLADPAAPTSTQIAVSPLGIVGYAQNQAERFGPLGVHPEWHGRGIGKLLTAATLTEMLNRGCSLVYIAWTYDEAARLYAQFGFREARRFAILEKAL